MSLSSIFFVGPLPPPVHGFSEINQRMLKRLSLSADVNVFDSSPHDRFYLFKLYFRFIFAIFRTRKGVLYLCLSGGTRQIIDIFFIIPAIFFGLKVYVHHHSFSYLNKTKLYSRFLFSLVSKSQHIVLCESMRDMLSQRFSIRKSQIRVISNVVFLKDIKKIDNKKFINKKLVVGFLSNIIKTKGCFEFIQLLNSATSAGLLIKGIMAGPVDSKIKDLFEKALLSSSCIEHIGPVYGKDKVKFFSQIDLLIFPTLHPAEAEPVTLWEAMGFGIPTVSISRGCIRSILTEEAGWVFEQDQFINDSMKLLKYLMNTESVLDKMSASARSNFEQRSFEFINKIEDLVLEITKHENDARLV